MAKKESIQKRLDKVRPPRVKLTYDVEIGEAVEQKEIPFVTGVLGDFTGKQDPDKPLPKLKERKFVSIDLDNFDDVMQGMAPAASYRVKNKMGSEGGEFAVSLKFNKMEDFRPESVVQQVEAAEETARGAHQAGRSAQQDRGQRKARRCLGRCAQQHRETQDAWRRSQARNGVTR